MTSGKTDWNITATVEGLGRAVDSAADSRWRFSTYSQESGTTGENLFVVAMPDKLPAEIPTEVDFRKGVSSVGAFSFVLQQHVQDADGDYTVAQRLMRGRWTTVGRLASAMTVNQTTITVEDLQGAAVTSLMTGYTARALAIEREVVILSSHAGSGVYNCTRGEFGTLAVAHGADVTDDREIFDAEHGHLLADREVVLSRIKRDGEIGGSGSDEVVLARGVFRDVQTSKRPNELLVKCSSVMELLQGRELCGSLWRRTIGEVEGGRASLRYGSLANRGRPNHRNSTNETIVAVEGGERAWALKGKQNTAGTWVVYRVADRADVNGADDTSAVAFAGSPYPATLADLTGKQVYEFFSLHPSAPDLNTSGDRLGSATVNGQALTSNFFVAALQILLTSPSGDNNATYDLGDDDNPGLYANLGAGIQADLVDISGIEDLALLNSGEATMNNLHLALDGEPFGLLEWLQRNATLIGCVWTIGTDGKLTCVQLRDVAPLSVTTLTESDFVGPPTLQRRRWEDVYDTVEVEWGERPGYGVATDTFTDVINQRRLISGRHRAHKLDARGYADVERLRSQVISRHVQRFHTPIPEITFTLLNTTSLWPGDFVKITHPFVFATDGTRGVTSADYMITARKVKLDGAAIGYRALQVGAAYVRTGRIAPSTLVTSYSAAGGADYGSGASNRINTDSTDPYVATVGPTQEVQNDDTDVWTAGDEFQVRTSSFGVRAAGPFEVAGVGSGFIDTYDSPSTAAAGDIICPAAYDSATAEQQGKWIWLADEAAGLGSTPDDGYDWTN